MTLKGALPTQTTPTVRTAQIGRIVLAEMAKVDLPATAHPRVPVSALQRPRSSRGKLPTLAVMPRMRALRNDSRTAPRHVLTSVQPSVVKVVLIGVAVANEVLTPQLDAARTSRATGSRRVKIHGASALLNLHVRPADLLKTAQIVDGVRRETSRSRRRLRPRVLPLVAASAVVGAQAPPHRRA